MNFNSFNTFSQWGVIETPEEKQIRDPEKEKQQQREKQEQEKESYEITSTNEKIEKNEIDLLVTSLGLSSLVNEIVEDKNKEEDVKVLKDNDEKILEIVLESDEDDEKESIDRGNLPEKNKEDDAKEVKEPENPFIEPKQVEIENPLQLSIFKRRSMPLIDYLCQLQNCVLKELHVLFYNIEKRREIILHLQNQVQLRTTHLLSYKNFVIRCNDFTVHPASIVPALGGYLGITVRGYYYVKHGFKLRHPYLPCIIEFGGGHHRSYYPLEVISVSMKSKQMKKC
uniref:PAZ domain-containing protein n=1 Tax=Meloidogyne incognita TaxID=6306 RepID=A0A914LUW6_MELIC